MHRPSLPVLLAALLAAPAALAQPQKLHVDLGNNTPIDLVLVPAGSFEQGSPATEANHQKDEEPQRTVRITHGFFMGIVPVTRGQFERFVAETRYRTEAEKGSSGGFGGAGPELVQKKEYTWQSPGFPQSDTNPVVIVTYADAQAFLAWVGPKLGHKARLPTEAEFEYAARAGTKTAWWSGATAEDAKAHGWFKDDAAGARPTGTKGANAFGLFDMSGDVFQWCDDWYGPYAAGDVDDPRVTSAPAGDTARRVLRGGSWLKDPKWGRSAARWRNTPGSRNADNGFRVVADLDALPAAAAATPAPTATTAPTDTPAPTTNAPSGGGAGAGAAVASMIFGCFGVGFLGVVGLVLWLALRNKSGGVTLAPQADGFTIHASHPPGTRVRWAGAVRGVDVGDVVPLEGPRTFVYTGEPPQQLRVISIELPNVAPAPRGYRGAAPPPARPRPQRAPNPPFRGYPPAY